MQTSTAVINVRAPVATRELIDRAAQIQGKSRTDFMLEAASIMARQALLDQVYFQVSEEQQCKLETLMNQPISQNTKLMELLASQSPWD